MLKLALDELCTSSVITKVTANADRRVNDFIVFPS
jgi:hypothetical protein